MILLNTIQNTHKKYIYPTNKVFVNTLINEHITDIQNNTIITLIIKINQYYTPTKM